jgi:hypothetical protein
MLSTYPIEKTGSSDACRHGGSMNGFTQRHYSLQQFDSQGQTKPNILAIIG